MCRRDVIPQRSGGLPSTPLNHCLRRFDGQPTLSSAPESSRNCAKPSVTRQTTVAGAQSVTLNSEFDFSG